MSAPVVGLPEGCPAEMRFHSAFGVHAENNHDMAGQYGSGTCDGKGCAKVSIVPRARLAAITTGPLAEDVIEASAFNDFIIEEAAKDIEWARDWIWKKMEVKPGENGPGICERLRRDAKWLREMPAAIRSLALRAPTERGAETVVSEATRALRVGIIDQDLGLKEAGAKIGRSVGTVKRCLKGQMGQRTAYRILKAFRTEVPN